MRYIGAASLGGRAQVPSEPKDDYGVRMILRVNDFMQPKQDEPNSPSH
ncbi:hypothetical protein AVEN_20599-1, partial [Araneus ventricosus]